MPKNPRPVPEGYHAVTPYLLAEDADGLIRFLEQAFEATLLSRYDGPDGRMAHAVLQVGDSKVMMGQSTPEWPPTRALIHLYVDDVDAVFRRALEAGGRVIRDPENTFYGDRSAGVDDPHGNQWWLATHVEDVSEEEMKRRHEAELEKTKARQA